MINAILSSSPEAACGDLQWRIEDPFIRDDIYKLIGDMGSKSYWRLLVDRHEYESIGARIDSVDPLLFLAYICSDNRLKESLRVVVGDMIMSMKFFGGLSEKLDKAIQKPDYRERLASFSRYLGVNFQELLDTSMKKDWRAFVSVILASV